MPGGARSVRPLRETCGISPARQACSEKTAGKNSGRAEGPHPALYGTVPKPCEKRPFGSAGPAAPPQKGRFSCLPGRAPGRPPGQAITNAYGRAAPAGGTPLRAALPAGTGRSRPTEGRVRPRLFLSFRIGYRALHEKIPFLSASGNGCPRHGGGGRKRTQRILCQGKAPA